MKHIIYQLLPRLFGNINDRNHFNGSIIENGCGKFNDITNKALKSIREFGATDIWLTGIIRHATTTGYEGFPANNPLIVKGKAGSPYAITDYFQVDPDLAVNADKGMIEFKRLVNRIHGLEMNVIIDFVPNHVSRQYNMDSFKGCTDRTDYFFEKDNMFYYIQNEHLTLPYEVYGQFYDKTLSYTEFPAKVTGNDLISATPPIDSWYDTIKLNYGVDISDNSKHFVPIPRTWSNMHKVLKFWLDKGVDGFRCDMAEMVPVEFWKWVIAEIRTEYPNAVFIAEIYKPDLYQEFLQAGFDYLYDKVDMYDSLKAIIRHQAGIDAITRSWQRTDCCNDSMLRFLENHDEVRIASDQFAGNPFSAIPAFVVSALMHKGPIMVYFGQELGENANGSCGFSKDDGKTTIFDYWCIDKIKRWNNEGKYNDKKLTDSEKSLRAKYSEILHFVSDNDEISEGSFYDLMWINRHLHDMKCYAFLRNINDKFILVAVNFNHYPVDITINLTGHVWDFLGIGKTDDSTVTCHIDGYGWISVSSNEIINQ